MTTNDQPLKLWVRETGEPTEDIFVSG